MLVKNILSNTLSKWFEEQKKIQIRNSRIILQNLYISLRSKKKSISTRPTKKEKTDYLSNVNKKHNILGIIFTTIQYARVLKYIFGSSEKLLFLEN